MTLKTAVTWWCLGMLTQKRYKALKQVYGDLDAALQEISPLMLRELGCKEEAAEKALTRLRDFQADAYIAAMEKKDVGLLSIEDERYPYRLREVADAPLFLSYRGDLSLLDHALIGVVGTRAMSPYGQRIVETFVPVFVRAHLMTVSGLALGIDSQVALQTMKACGRTVAVLGNGLASIYPASNRRLGEKIVQEGGLLLSEFPLEMPPDTYTFPSRNRIIAGLTEGTLVCEAPEGSGSVITAELALDYNREVFAVPGSIFDPNFAGCHTLIMNGHAHLVTQPEDVLNILGILVPGEKALPAYTPETPEERSVYSALTALPQTTDLLIEKTGRPAADVSVALTMLELAGASQQLPDGTWIRR